MKRSGSSHFCELATDANREPLIVIPKNATFGTVVGENSTAARIRFGSWRVENPDETKSAPPVDM
jgi:hypothetical protein